MFMQSLSLDKDCNNKNNTVKSLSRFKIVSITIMNIDINCITLCRGISDIASQNTLKAEPSRCNKELGDLILSSVKSVLTRKF